MSNPADHEAFAFTPSLHESARVQVAAAATVPAEVTVLGVLVTTDGAVPAELGVDRAALEAAGFKGAAGTTLTVPFKSGPLRIAIGAGANSDSWDVAALRDAAAVFARAAANHTDLAISVSDTGPVAAVDAAQAMTEGALLARYRFDVLRSKPTGIPVQSLTLVGAADHEGAQVGAEFGRATAAATALARDLANSPHSHLSASRMADIAVALGHERGFDVEVWDRERLIAEGIGGIVSVNSGSSEPPRMIKLSYRPSGETGHLAFVGKGIMYDSGGISRKPADIVHAAMKNDMSGAGAILAAVAALAETGSKTGATGYLMCTDNMPSGTAMAMGDVITIRGGTTIEVVNTDAEGRLVMADGLVLAAEEKPDAIVDIATLTGASMRALGTEVASVFGNNQALIDQVRAAGDSADEPVWHMPLYTRYRKQLDSPIADMKNLGYSEGGAITAALFLVEFVDGLPWAHIDMAGTALSTDGRPWHTAGCTGFGARLLVELAMRFEPPAN